MSKEAALRAMREARYAERTGSSAAPSRAARSAARPAARPAKSRASDPAPATAAADPVTAAPTEDALCGHRSMNGRSCTREQGHAAKSHRYS